MNTKRMMLAMGLGALVYGCAGQPDETQEIIGNLAEAGFSADDIKVVDDVVYVGGDAELSLEASREMVQTGTSTKEQYRTTNTVSTSLTKICINAPGFTGVFSTALDLAIQNYDQLPLTFSMARTPSTGCSATINAFIQPGGSGGVSGFPSGGLPFSSLSIGSNLVVRNLDTIEHVITHEIGHTIGFRHSDYFNRSISCGVGGAEPDEGVGQILIPGTPSGATLGGSIMNACFGNNETGEFTASDLTALRKLYGSRADILWRNANTGLLALWTMSGGTLLSNQVLQNPQPAEQHIEGIGDFNGDGDSDILWRNVNTGTFVLWTMSGATLLSSQQLQNPQPAEQHVEGIDDFDGDGKADILWRNINTGTLVMWMMSGGTILSNPQLQFPQVAQQQVEGTGDFDGDRKADILWRNVNTGVLVLWTMSGGTILSNPQLPFPQVAQQHVEGVADFDGDGRSDILWRNVTNGVLVMWLMSGGTILANPQLQNTEPVEWQVAGTAEFGGL